MTEPAWVTEMTPEQRAVMAPPGLLHVDGRRNGSHQTRPKLNITYPLERTATVHSAKETDETVGTQPERASAAVPAVPLMGPEQAYLFDTTGYLHIKQAISAEEVSQLHTELDWAEETGADHGKMLQVRIA